MNLDKEKFKQEFRKRLILQIQNHKKHEANPPPRYDDIFYQGVKWLNNNQ